MSKVRELQFFIKIDEFSHATADLEIPYSPFAKCCLDHFISEQDQEKKKKKKKNLSRIYFFQNAEI